MKICQGWRFVEQRLASNQLAFAAPIHRNIAEGYCRKSLVEYFQFLSIALAALGESVSAMAAYRRAGQLNSAQFEQWDALVFKLENGLLKRIKSLEKKRYQGEWDDAFLSGSPMSHTIQ